MGDLSNQQKATDLAANWVEGYHPGLRWEELPDRLQDQIWDAAKQLVRYTRDRTEDHPAVRFFK